MFESIDKEKFLNIYNYFESMKHNSQRRKLGEEHQELIEELTKFDLGVGDIDNVIDELSDNFNVLFQLMYVYEIEPKEIYDRMIFKLKRTEKRIKDKFYEK